jgi:hypothetical protein
MLLSNIGSAEDRIERLPQLAAEGSAPISLGFCFALENAESLLLSVEKITYITDQHQLSRCGKALSAVVTLVTHCPNHVTWAIYGSASTLTGSYAEQYINI